MMGTEAIHNLDSLIRLFDRANVLTGQQRERLYLKYEDERWNRVWNDKVSYQDAFDVEDFYRQDAASFRSFLKDTDQNLAWQCQKVSADFRKYLETGEMPPPYFPMRIAIILRKAKEHEREKRFLAAWVRHFGHLANENKGDLELVKRAQKLGVRPVPSQQHRMTIGDVVSVRNDHDFALIVEFNCGPYGSFRFPLPAGHSFMYTAGEKEVDFRFSDSALDIPKDAKVIPIKQDN